MSDQVDQVEDSADSAPSSNIISWADFLANTPPGQRRMVNLLADDTGDTTWSLAMPSIKLFCPNSLCEREVFFDHSGYGATTNITDICWKFLHYRCRHCKTTTKIYAILARLDPKQPKLLRGEAEKLGEWPAFGPHVPTRLNKLIGPDRDFFFKGRRAESQGMGIGAFGYYRRVVENQKNRIFDEIIKVCQQVQANEKFIKELERAKAEKQFNKAVGKIKKGIPDVLKVNGQNPLLLLHHALSEGLHAQNDEQCLELATSIRIVLSDLSERLEQALKEDAELKNAVSRLLKAQSGKAITRKAPETGPESDPLQGTPPGAQ
jgi:hypothetical protein